MTAAVYRRMLGYARPYVGRLALAMVFMLFVSALNGSVAFLVKPALDDIFIRKDESRLLWIPLAVLTVYLHYLRIQERAGSPVGANVDAAAYRASHRTMLRLWSFLGPTTNRTALILAALYGRTDAYLWFASVPANAWLLVCYVLERRERP